MKKNTTTEAESKETNRDAIQDNQQPDIKNTNQDATQDNQQPDIEGGVNKIQIDTEMKEISVDDLKETIEMQKRMILDLEKQKKAAEEKMLRTTADVLNKQKRNEQELEKQKKYSLKKIVNEMLPVIDNLDRTLEVKDIQKDVQAGIEITLKEFISALKKNGVSAIEPKANDVFNAEKHHAIQQLESKDQASNTVIEVVQKGYEINGRLLRAALVVVAK